MIFTLRTSILKCVAVALLMMLAACSDPAPEVTPLEQAQNALARGDGLGAEIILREMMDDGSSRADVAAYLGEAELSQGELVEARQWLQDGEFSDASRGHGFHMLARLEMEEGNLPAAGAAFDNSLSVNRENSELWVDIGRLRYRGGEQAQAVEASIYAVELDPENAAALQFRAQLVRDAEGMHEALPWFERALERNPQNVDLLADYAATLGELGRARDMLKVVREIATIDPANRRIFYLQSVLAARAGKFELAQLLLLRATKDDREKPAGMLLSGIIDIENGNFASAAQTLGQLYAKQPDNRRVRQLLARALSLGLNDKELIYRFESAARLPSASPYLQTLVGRSFEAIDERDKAAFFLNDAARRRWGGLVPVPTTIELDVAEARGPETGLDTLALVRARITNGRAGNAPSAANAFLERFPGSSDALSLAGDASLAAGKYASATNLYQQSAAIRGTWALTKKRIDALLSQDKREAALGLLATHFVGDPGNVEAVTMLSIQAAERGDWNGAAIFADHALANGGDRDPLILSLRAEIALRNGDIGLGTALAERAYYIQPLNRDAAFALAIAYRKLPDGEARANELEIKVNRLPLYRRP